MGIGRLCQSGKPELWLRMWRGVIFAKSGSWDQGSPPSRAGTDSSKASSPSSANCRASTANRGFVRDAHSKRVPSVTGAAPAAPLTAEWVTCPPCSRATLHPGTPRQVIRWAKSSGSPQKCFAFSVTICIESPLHFFHGIACEGNSSFGQDLRGIRHGIGQLALGKHNGKLRAA